MKNNKSIRILFSIAFVFCNIILLNAQNLVSNPSFETNTACPNTWGRIPDAPPWQIPAGHSGTANYFNVCGSLS